MRQSTFDINSMFKLFPATQLRAQKMRILLKKALMFDVGDINLKSVNKKMAEHQMMVFNKNKKREVQPRILMIPIIFYMFFLIHHNGLAANVPREST